MNSQPNHNTVETQLLESLEPASQPFSCMAGCFERTDDLVVCEALLDKLNGIAHPQSGKYDVVDCVCKFNKEEGGMVSRWYPTQPLTPD